MSTTNSDTPTVKVRRSRERGFEDFGWTDNWMTFFQMISGQVRIAEVTLAAGDGAGITNGERLNFEFDEASEAVLFDVRMDLPL